MTKFHWTIFLLAWMIYSSGVLAQTTPGIIFPADVEGSLSLNISSFLNQDKKALGYQELAVFVQNESGEYGSSPIQGRFRLAGNELLFKPYFPFEKGMTYVARIKNLDSEGEYFSQSFQIGKKKKLEPAKMVSIYPTSDQLPENLLRFYLYFNTPMKKGEALKHIQLIDEEGNIDKHAFMEFKQELWSADGKRLTILFDPGRIKRGVSTNVSRGPALREGKKYKLSISANWQDVYGQSLPINTSKEFEVSKGYRQSIKAREWKIVKPKAGTQDFLRIHFDRIMDHALLQSMIKLEDEENKLISGYWEVLEEEDLVRFIPENKWKAGNYRLLLDSRLEDVAGNNLQNLLDTKKDDKGNNNLPYQAIDFQLSY